MASQCFQGQQLLTFTSQGDPKASRLALLTSLAGKPMGASPLGVALQRGVTTTAGTNFYLWMKLNKSNWLKLRHDTASPNRASWRTTKLVEVHSIYRAVDASVVSGTWSFFETAGSGTQNSAISCRTRQTGNANAALDFTVIGQGSEPYDVKVSFTGKTSGSYCIPTVNGSQTLIDAAIVDPAPGGTPLGVRAFLTYTATDNTRANIITIAKELTGTNTIRLQQRTSPNGAVLSLEAIAITSKPGASNTEPPTWVSGSYYKGDEIFNNGYYYRLSNALAGGVSISSTIAPTHTTGSSTLADGCTWFMQPDTTYQYTFSKDLDYQSEREYHVIANVNSVDDDIGGQTHGSDTLVSRTILLDGVAWTENSSWSVATGSTVVLSETSTFEHVQNANLASTTCIRTYTGAAVHIDTVITWLGAAALRSYYPGMMPALKNNGSVEIFNSCNFSSGYNFTLSAYSGPSYAGTSGEQLASTALAAVYNSTNTLNGLLLSMGLAVSSETVNNWNNTGSRASVQPNVGGVTTGLWQSKTYFTGIYTVQVNVSLGIIYKLNVTHAFGAT